MIKVHGALAAATLLLSLVVGNSTVLAQAPMAQAPQADAPRAEAQTVPGPDRSLTGDAVCTRCHDESETRAILSIYQTKHGVKGDSRTPGCQSCHGTSEKHLKDKKFPPDVTFGENKSVARVQNAVCLGCHKADRRARWDGGQHQLNDVACASCHQVHARVDPVLDRYTQAAVCFTCHKEQRADSLKVSTHAIDTGKVVCSDCHNVHGSAGPKTTEEEYGQRNLLHLPRRETRSVPLGASACDRGLH